MSGGFDQADFAHTAELLRSGSDKMRDATLSNNFNIILAALDIAAEKPDAKLIALAETGLEAIRAIMGLERGGLVSPKLSLVEALAVVKRLKA